MNVPISQKPKFILLGFCVHRGTCRLEIGNFLSGLSDKSVALFGTCGAGNSPEYYKEIASSVRIWLEDDNHYLGSFNLPGENAACCPSKI